jgi:hypothetical protein
MVDSMVAHSLGQLNDILLLVQRRFLWRDSGGSHRWALATPGHSSPALRTHAMNLLTLLEMI